LRSNSLILNFSNDFLVILFIVTWLLFIWFTLFPVSPHHHLPLFGVFTPFLRRSPVAVTVHPSWPACIVVFWWCEDGLIRIPVSDSGSDSVLGFLVLVGGFLGGELGGSLQGRWWLSPCLPSWFQKSSPFKAFDLWSFQICWDLQFSWLPIRRLHADGLGFFLVFMFVGYFCTVCIVFVRIVCSLFLFDHRLGDRWRGLILRINPKGSVTKTRKGLVTNVLDSSLDLSSYMLFARKSFYACYWIKEPLALGFCTVLAVDPFTIITF